jgi:hypothetical protein
MRSVATQTCNPEEPRKPRYKKTERKRKEKELANQVMLNIVEKEEPEIVPKDPAEIARARAEFLNKIRENLEADRMDNSAGYMSAVTRTSIDTDAAECDASTTACSDSEDDLEDSDHKSPFMTTVHSKVPHDQHYCTDDHEDALDNDADDDEEPEQPVDIDQLRKEFLEKISISRTKFLEKPKEPEPTSSLTDKIDDQGSDDEDADHDRSNHIIVTEGTDPKEFMVQTCPSNYVITHVEPGAQFFMDLSLVLLYTN